MVEAVIELVGELSGSVNAPPSKSYTHRAVIAASLSDGKSEIVNPLICDDTEATINACESLGAYIVQKRGKLTVQGERNLKAPEDVINCRESASTLRFMTAVAALAEGTSVLTGGPTLLKRPIGPLVQSLKQLGVRCMAPHGYPPVKVYGGGILGGETTIVGDVSSQFLTGLLLACPQADNDSRVSLATELESLPYALLTLHVLKKHGIKVRVSDDYRNYVVLSKQAYKPFNHLVVGDFSSAAFLIAAGAVTNSHVKIEGLDTSISQQPDMEILRILSRMGARMRVDKNSVEVMGGRLRGVEIDAKDIPDLVPVCAVLGCYADGKTVIYNARRLRIKESDRLASTSSELGRMGARILETEDGLEIDGPCSLRGGDVDPHSDHRIAMACSVAALGVKGKTRILDAECVKKSYLNFFNDLMKLGVNVKLA